MTERAIEDAVNLFLEIEKVVVEGAGAAGIAAIIEHPERFAGKPVGVVLTGGNIDPRLLASVILRGSCTSGRLSRLRVGLDDRPGSLSQLTASSATPAATSSRCITSVCSPRRPSAAPRSTSPSRPWTARTPTPSSPPSRPPATASPSSPSTANATQKARTRRGPCRRCRRPAGGWRPRGSARRRRGSPWRRRAATGASSDAKHSSAIHDATSPPNPPVRMSSCTTRHGPSCATDSATSSWSHGTSQRRSMTSTTRRLELRRRPAATSAPSRRR